jgi:hypothetical protein
LPHPGVSEEQPGENCSFCPLFQDGTAIAFSKTREGRERTEITVTRNRAKGERITRGTLYHAKQFHLSGLTGISDQTIALHFKLYEGYVNETNRLLEKIADLNWDIIEERLCRLAP